MQHLYDSQWLETCGSGQILGRIMTTASRKFYSYLSLNDLGLIQKSITVHRFGAPLRAFNLFQLGVRATFISYQRQFDVTKIYTVPKYPISRGV